MTEQDKKDEIIALAKRIKREGLKVFISKTGTYGIYTDESESRVVYFQCDYNGVRFAGCTEPNRSSGTGWRISKNSSSFRDMLYYPCPDWASKPSHVPYSTLKNKLNRYSSSQYIEYNN
jgi:hypothetical protein